MFISACPASAQPRVQHRHTVMLIAIETSQFKCPVHSRSWKTYLKTDVLEEKTDEVLEGVV